MAKDPAKGQVIGRRWKYAPPPWRIYDALADELDRWFPFLPGELRPKLSRASERPSLIVFRPWIEPTIQQVEIELGPDDGPGSSLRILATAVAKELSDEERRRVRYRLGTIFGSALRDWVDEPHW